MDQNFKSSQFCGFFVFVGFFFFGGRYLERNSRQRCTTCGQRSTNSTTRPQRLPQIMYYLYTQYRLTIHTVVEDDLQALSVTMSHNNDVRFVLTSNCLQDGSCHIYVIHVCVCFRIAASNTYCVVFLFCFSSCVVPHVASFSGFSIFDCPFGIL